MGVPTTEFAPDTWKCQNCDVNAYHRARNLVQEKMAYLAQARAQEEEMVREKERVEREKAQEKEKKKRKPRRPSTIALPATQPIPAPPIVPPTPSEPPPPMTPWKSGYTHVEKDIVSDQARNTIRAIARKADAKSPRVTSALWDPAADDDDTDELIDIDGPDPPIALLSPISTSIPILLPKFPPTNAILRHHEHSTSSDFLRPPTYTLHTRSSAPAASFLTPYTSEITTSSSYLSDPLNAYPSTGLPKPHVRLLPDLALDARKKGNDGRWARRGCHPNAVLRPVICTDPLPLPLPPPSTSSTSNPTPIITNEHANGVDRTDEVGFALFATRELDAGEEIVLGWEWDDGHVVHQMQSVIDARYEGKALPQRYVLFIRIVYIY